MPKKYKRFSTRIRKIGNSKGIIIPFEVMEANMQEVGYEVELVHQPGSLTINFITPKLKARKRGA